MRFDEIINKYVIIVIVSTIVAASIGYVVSMYTYRGSMLRIENETRSIVYMVTSRTVMLEDRIDMLTKQLDKLEKEIDQNRILIQSLESNVHLQMNLITESLSPKESKK